MTLSQMIVLICPLCICASVCSSRTWRGNQISEKPTCATVDENPCIVLVPALPQPHSACWMSEPAVWRGPGPHLPYTHNHPAQS